MVVVVRAEATWTGLAGDVGTGDPARKPTANPVVSMSR
jgi:hypothetical protein